MMHSKTRLRRAAPRGMTLVETMLVLAIIGIFAAIATPGLQSLLGVYAGKSSGLAVVSAVRAARDFSQKANAVTQIRWDGADFVIEKQGHDNSDLVKIIGGTWVEEARYPVPQNVTIINFPLIYFCASPEGRYRGGSAAGPRVCAIGSVSQTAQQNTPTPDAIIQFKVRDEPHTITVTSALGNATLRRGT